MTKGANQPDSANPAVTVWLTIACQWRRVADLERFDAMNLVVLIISLAVGLSAVYFLSAGLAFALMYRIGRRFPSRAASAFYSPLEWLAQRWRIFGRVYNALCVWSYRIIVGGPLHGGWPPPPPSV